MWLYCLGADSPDASLPDVKNIALFYYQNSRARACPVAFLGNQLAQIPKLYGIESRLKGASVEKRQVERQTHAKPILDELYEWMMTQKVVESSALGKAIKYTLGHGLSSFVISTMVIYLSITSVLNVQLNRWLLAEKTGSSPIIPMVLRLAQCCIASLRQQRQMTLSSIIRWSSA